MRDRKLRVGSVQFLVSPIPCNMFEYAAWPKNEEELKIAVDFAKFFGMLILKAKVNAFLAEATWDTQTYIIPFRMQEFLKKLEESKNVV